MLSPSERKVIPVSYFVLYTIHAFWNTERSTSVGYFVKLYIIDSRTLNEIMNGYITDLLLDSWLVLVLSDGCLKTEYVGDENISS